MIIFAFLKFYKISNEKTLQLAIKQFKIDCNPTDAVSMLTDEGLEVEVVVYPNL
jgi:hypothetical protein